MNSSFIRYILGRMMQVEGVFLLIPAIVGLGYREGGIVKWYGLCALLAILLGQLLTIKKYDDTTLYLKDGCILTGACWVMLSFVGAMPFWLSGEIPGFFDAIFESVSGFTTTGASILSDVEAMSHTGLFWRSFTHWIGGMGILVFILAILPLAGGSNLNIMKAESTGQSVGKLVPSIKQTAGILYLIYILLTLIELVLLIVCRMPLFDAVCTAFGTAGTGGFGIKADSIAGYNLGIKWVVTIFMMLFGVNFYFFYAIILGKIKKALSMEEVRVFACVILVAVIAIFVDIYKLYDNIGIAFTDAAFQVGTIISSTGFATCDFDKWPEFSRLLLMLLTFMGSCAGSTGGGMKVSRLIVLFKTARREIKYYVHPSRIYKLTLDGKTVEPEVIRGIKAYFVTYMLVFIISTLIISLHGEDQVTGITAVIACINNTGPGLAGVGPSSNFGFFAWWAKLVLIFDMLAGRLELFPMIMLLNPIVWRDLVLRKNKEAKRRKENCLKNRV